MYVIEQSDMFHDNHVYGFTIEEGEYGFGKLVLDIDHILEWIKCEDDTFAFSVAPALLIFHDVADLEIVINYRDSSAAMGPFSIHNISSALETSRSGVEYKKWTIELNWPAGSISFVSSGYKLELQSKPVQSGGQFLGSVVRKSMIASN